MVTFLEENPIGRVLFDIGVGCSVIRFPYDVLYLGVSAVWDLVGIFLPEDGKFFMELRGGNDVRL